MTDQNQTHGTTKYFLAGLLVGGLAGTVTMLLMAPQSGKATRDQIQAKGIELRDEVTETAENTVAKARLKGQQISADVREKAEELQQRGQDMLDEQREHLATLVAGDDNGNKVS